MTYILITIALQLSSYKSFTNGVGLSSGQVQNDVQYNILKNEEDLAEKFKECSDSQLCSVVAVIGCDWKGCKEYTANISTSPEIKNTIKLEVK